MKIKTYKTKQRFKISENNEINCITLCEPNYDIMISTFKQKKLDYVWTYPERDSILGISTVNSKAVCCIDVGFGHATHT